MQAVAEACRASEAKRWARTQLAVGDRRVLFAGILIISLLLRLWFVDAKGLWFDEAFSATIARYPIAQIPTLLSRGDTHPPLHYFLLHFWMAFFGSSEVSLRSLSILGSLVTIACTVLLARRMLGDAGALLAGLLLAFSPLSIGAAQEARMYPQLSAFIAASSYALWLALEEGRRRHWIAYGICVLGSLYTHHFAWMSLGGQIAFVLAWHRAPSILKSFGGILSLVALAYAPGVPLLVTEFGAARGMPIIRPPFSFSALTDAFGLMSFGGNILGMGTHWQAGSLPLELRGPVLLPFVLLTFAGVVALPGWRQRVFLLGYWLIPLGTICLIAPKWNLFYPRYFSYLLTPLVILFATGILHISNAMRGRQRWGTLAGLLILLAAFQFPALRQAYADNRFHGWRPAAQLVEKKVGPDDFLLFIPAFARIPFDYYFHGTQRRASLNPTELLHAREKEGPVFKLDSKNLAALAERHPHLWIIATVPLGYDARMRMNGLLTPHFKEIEGTQFGIVYAFRWKSLRYVNSSSR